MGHETPRNRTAAGGAAPTGHRVAKSGRQSVGCSTGGRVVREFGAPVVRIVPKEGNEGPAPATDPRPSCEVVVLPEGQAPKDFAERPPRGGVSDRLMDVRTRGRDDRPGLWRSVPSLSRVEAFERVSVELPKAGAPSLAERREGHRPLETASVAAYKKTPIEREPIWSFSMNRASCSRPMWCALGHRRGRRPSSTTGSSKTGYRPSVSWRCLPAEGDCLFMSSFELGISPVWISGLFSNSCCGICDDTWFSCGTAVRSIGVKRYGSFFSSIRESMWNIFQLTHLSLTQPNRSGTDRIAPWPTVRMKTWANWAEGSDTRCTRPSNPKSFYGLAFMRLTCRGQDDYFHYLCKTQ